MNIEGKTVVITGGAGGLGLSMASALAAKGASIAIIDLDPACIATAIEVLPAAKGYAANISDEEQVERVFESIKQDFGCVDVLINNAGITNDGLMVKQREGVVSKTPLAKFQPVLDVNLTGSFLCAREASALMIDAQSSGLIINISSISRAGNVGQSSYAAAKAGVVAFTSTWCKELAKYNIRVVAIAPGFIKTAMTSKVPAEVLSKIEQTIPLKRLGEPNEIASGVLFAIENDYFNGRVLEIDGGLRL
ncbi:SDR family oxidoreductase [Arenicella xantha]|uniref:3-oxoacyl-[acyl-carrier protein] reductase n=1 Tax=Arenicella xantha TaxID=644221 RepID=A0A395JQ94_9GAMM|nr:SDR family oxidoreductase [Arenicella xantha]RBP51748.1 3-oxoacyl-[acyl-carrier protein] reductase [Arenicella xantha]